MSDLPELLVQGKSCLDGQIHVTFERATPWPGEDVTAMEAVVETFVAAGARSAYACPGTPAGQSMLALVSSNLGSPTDLVVCLDSRQVDARSFQLLRHMASRIELANDESLKRITVICLPQRSAPRAVFPVIDWDNEEDLYPEEPVDPGFAVESDETEYAKMRRVLVEFATRPDRAAVDELEAYAGDWGRLLEAGAFAMPLGPPDVIDAVMGKVSRFDVLTAEIEISVYQASECGLDVLLHMLAAYHVRARPIQVVTIE